MNGKVIRNITHSEKALANTVIEQCDFIKSLEIKKHTVAWRNKFPWQREIKKTFCKVLKSGLCERN